MLACFVINSSLTFVVLSVTYLTSDPYLIYMLEKDLVQFAPTFQSFAGWLFLKQAVEVIILTWHATILNYIRYI